MDANHFRRQAARAREMADAGEDPRLAQMLREVACDLDAEAEAIDAEAEAIDAEAAGAIITRNGLTCGGGATTVSYTSNDIDPIAASKQ